MSEKGTYQTFSLILIICSTLIFLISGLIAWMLDSVIWEWLENATRNDPFFLSEEIKYLILHLKKGNLGILTFSGISLALGIGLRLQLPWFRQSLTLLFAFCMLFVLAYPVWEWKLLDDLFLEQGSGSSDLADSIFQFKLITGLLAIGLAIFFALIINRLTDKTPYSS